MSLCSLLYTIVGKFPTNSSQVLLGYVIAYPGPNVHINIDTHVGVYIIVTHGRRPGCGPGHMCSGLVCMTLAQAYMWMLEGWNGSRVPNLAVSSVRLIRLGLVAILMASGHNSKGVGYLSNISFTPRIGIAWWVLGNSGS